MLNIMMTLLNAFLVTFPPAFSFDSLTVSMSLLRVTTQSCTLYFFPFRTLYMLIVIILNPCFDNFYICFISESDYYVCCVYLDLSFALIMPCNF